MKIHIEQLILQALRKLEQSGELPAIPAFVEVSASREIEHGDYSSNIAMSLMRLSTKTSMELATLILSALPVSPYLKKVEIAAPGFLNFYLTSQVMNDVITTILTKQQTYGRCKIGRGKRILVEFLSSNPTCPLHIGHGRHAAYGIAVANLLDAVGFKTYREYYINDAGEVVDQLTISVWLRYLALCGATFSYPDYLYQGDYVTSIAEAIKLLHGDHFYHDMQDEVMFLQNEVKTLQLSCLIEKCKRLLGDKYAVIHDLSFEHTLADIREEMAEFHIHYDNWFSECQLTNSGIVENVLDLLSESSATYKDQGILYLRTTEWGDDKDRILIKKDGKQTCFLHDIAYHYTKFDRGFDIAVDIFGKDKQAYLPRLRAAMCALGIDSERLVHIQLEWVNLYRGDEKIPLLKNNNDCMSLRELREEVGNDVTRFIYLMRKYDQAIEFNIEGNETDNHDHSIHYVQYAYTRILGVFRQLKEKTWEYVQENGIAHLDQLVSEHEGELIHLLSQYPDTVMNAALRYDPHLLTQYLRRLAAHFHAYYTATHFLVENEFERNARLALISAVKQVLKNGCQLLGYQLIDDELET